jgi:hypothetical protein
MSKLVKFKLFKNNFSRDFQKNTPKEGFARILPTVIFEPEIISTEV